MARAASPSSGAVGRALSKRCHSELICRGWIHSVWENHTWGACGQTSKSLMWCKSMPSSKLAMGMGSCTESAWGCCSPVSDIVCTHTDSPVKCYAFYSAHISTRLTTVRTYVRADFLIIQLPDLSSPAGHFWPVQHLQTLGWVIPLRLSIQDLRGL